MLQTKLTINQPGDAYEQEADRVADQVMRMPEPQVQRACAACEEEMQRQPLDEEEEELQMQAAGPAPAAPATAPPIVQSVLNAPGRPLDAGTRAFMEPRFGQSFGHVRVHTGAQAAESARSVNARAYTVGRNMVFGAGQYAPQTSAGQQLLAHELTHVVQQTGGNGYSTAQNDMTGRTSNTILRKTGQFIMRKGFESTVEICHRVLESRRFKIDRGGVRVVLLLEPLDKSIPNCRDFEFGVTLTQSVDWWPDDEIGTCKAMTGGARSFSFANLSSSTYYLTIWRIFDHPYCCLKGDILVFDEPVSSDSSDCKRDSDPSVMDVIHGALDAAGFIPALGAIPDGINAVIYAAEGDWTNAGISVVAMVPAFGDGAKLAIKGGKEVVEASGKSVIRMGEDQLATNLKNVAGRSGRREAAERAGREIVESQSFVRGGIRFRWRAPKAAFDALESLPPGAQVYVFRDAANRVMYVGYTEQGAVKRAGQHLYEKAGDFLGDAASVEVKGGGLLEREARALEQDLIEEFRPKWNIETNPYTRKYGDAPNPADISAANNTSIRLELVFD